MKSSAATERSKGAAKAPAPPGKAAKGKAAAAAPVQGSAAKDAPAKAPATKAATAKAAAAEAAVLKAAKAISAASTSAKSNPAKQAAPQPAAPAKAARKTDTTPAPRHAAAQPASVAAASLRSAPSSPPAAHAAARRPPVATAPAPAPAPKSAAKPQIETSHIVTASANDAPARPASAEAPAARPAEAPRPGMQNGRPTISRASNKDESFAEGDYVVYPTHGVGKVEKIAKEEIAGHHLELIHITFEENRMTLRVPVSKARSAGLRKLATRKMFDEALAVLKGRARVKRTMWSRRAQEYEAKINSGDPAAIAEVVRDLHRNAGQPDQSFSERQIYEAAMDRLAAELAALDQTDKPTALTKLGNFLKTL